MSARDHSPPPYQTSHEVSIEQRERRTDHARIDAVIVDDVVDGGDVHLAPPIGGTDQPLDGRRLVPRFALDEGVPRIAHLSTGGDGACSDENLSRRGGVALEDREEGGGVDGFDDAGW